MKKFTLNHDSDQFIKTLTSRAPAALQGQNLLEMPMDAARKAFNQLIAPVAGKLPTIELQIENKKIDRDGHAIPVRIFKPIHADQALPILIYCHGGGFVFGDPDFLDYTCRALAKNANCIVVSVDYRRAPEHKFPTAHEDCYFVAKYVQQHAKEFGGNGVIAVGGDSAGGNMAASICHMAKKSGEIKIAFQLLYYPWVDLNNTMESDKVFATGFFLETTTLHWMRKQYLSKPEEEKNPTANPQLQTDFTGLPPALVVTAEYDPIHDDAKLYYEKLVQAGVPAQYAEFGGILHDFCALPSHYDAALLAFEISAAALRKAFNHR